MNIIDNLKKAIELLNINDEYSETLSDELSKRDLAISDLLHYVENNNLKTNECYRFVKEIQKLRTERRKIINDIALMRDYETNKQKLTNKDNRGLLLTSIKLTEKNNNMPYKNRIYNDVEEMLKEKKNEKILL